MHSRLAPLLLKQGHIGRRRGRVFTLGRYLKERGKQGLYQPGASSGVAPYITLSLASQLMASLFSNLGLQ